MRGFVLFGTYLGFPLMGFSDWLLLLQWPQYTMPRKWFFGPEKLHVPGICM